MEKANILVVEDEAVVAMDIGSCLRHLGHPEPTITTTGEDALTKTAQMHPDLVLMDITLKGKMDGFEAAAQIRDSYHVPIIYLTGNSDETAILRAARDNPNGYLLKPFNERGLGTSIEMALQRHRLEQELRDGEAMKRAALDALLDCILTLDQNGKITDCNSAGEKLFGYRRGKIIGASLAELLIPSALLERESQWVIRNLLSGARASAGRRIEITATRADGSTFPAEIAVTQAESRAFMVCLRDITERKRTALEMERLVQKLQETLAAKTLTGLIPICASCKMIRDDQGNWNQVEQYVMNHSEATFTHGCCPECAHQMMAEFFKDRREA